MIKLSLFLFIAFLCSNSFAAQVNIITAGDMSQATVTSSAIDVGFYDVVSIQNIYTGAPVGTLKLQVSNKFVANSTCATIANADWSDISGSSYAIAAAGDVVYNLANISYKCLRAVYTKTSGTGVLNAILATKDYL